MKWGFYIMYQEPNWHKLPKKFSLGNSFTLAPPISSTLSLNFSVLKELIHPRHTKNVNGLLLFFFFSIYIYLFFLII